MLALSGLTGLLYYFGFYSEIYNYLSDVMGYSILGNLVMYKYYSNKKFCDTTRIAVLGLIFMNLTSLAGYFVDMYSPLYDTYIFILIIGIIVFYKKEIEK